MPLAHQPGMSPTLFKIRRGLYGKRSTSSLLVTPESTRIGLKSVERLLEHIGGKLQTTMEADIFLLKMEISSGHFKNSPARK